jgi:Glycosyltransferase (GlcNAc)
MAVRLFVRGYDLYAPTESVCYHLWSRAHRPPTTTEENIDDEPKETRQRLRDESMAIVYAQLTRTDSHSIPASSAALVRDVPSFGAAIGVDFRSRRILK